MEAVGRFPHGDGCSLWAACLSCPLPRCRYEMPPRAANAWMRARALVPLVQRGRPVEEMAMRIGTSRRTVFRLLPLARALARSGEVGDGPAGP